MLDAYRENEDLILMGAYRKGTSAATDRALERLERIDAFLTQSAGEPTPIAATRQALADLVS